MDAAPSIEQIASCIGGYDPDALSVEQAQAFIARFVSPVAEVESVGLHAALGRVLAADLVSTIDVPSHDNSAMDGYALRGSDLSTTGDTRLRVTKMPATITMPLTMAAMPPLSSGSIGSAPMTAGANCSNASTAVAMAMTGSR